MKAFKRIVSILIALFAGLYLLIITILYFQQESLIFPARKLSPDYKFTYIDDFEELNILVDNDITINGLLFKAEKTKVLIFYLHGNGGNI